MKKLPLILIALICCAACTGQSIYRKAFQQGTILTGMNTSIDWGTIKWDVGYEGINATTFTITPKFGFFVSDGIALGMELDLSNTWFNEDNIPSYRETTAGAFFRINTPDGFFFQADYALGKRKEVYDSATTINFKIKKLQFGVGYSFLISKAFAIEPCLMYQHYLSEVKEDAPYYNSIKNGVVLSIGLSAFLSRKK